MSEGTIRRAYFLCCRLLDNKAITPFCFHCIIMFYSIAIAIRNPASYSYFILSAQHTADSSAVERISTHPKENCNCASSTRSRSLIRLRIYILLCRHEECCCGPSLLRNFMQRAPNTHRSTAVFFINTTRLHCSRRVLQLSMYGYIMCVYMEYYHTDSLHS